MTVSPPKPIGLASDEHITSTVAVLEDALVEARAGNLSTVIVFADIRSSNGYRIWKSAPENYLTVVGKMQQACVDMCSVRVHEGGF